MKSKFLHKKALIIHNQRRAKNHLELLKKELFQEVERIINKEEIPLEYQQTENVEIFKKAFVKILDKNIKIWSHEQI